MSETPNTITAIKKELLMRLGHDADIFALISLCTREPYVVCDEETFDDEVFLFLDEEEAKKEEVVQRSEEVQTIIDRRKYLLQLPRSMEKICWYSLPVCIHWV